MSTTGTTKVLRCKCEHEFQDSRYGKGMRVHNQQAPNSKTDWRCTVCGDGKLNSPAKAAKKEEDNNKKKKK